MDSFTIEKSGESLHQFLSAKYPHLSKKKVKERIESGAARVQGRQITLASYMLAKGEKVSFDQGQSRLLPEQKIKTLFEDDRLLIVDKPPFITSEEASATIGRVFLVHRLDKETSGCLLMAKDPITLALLEDEFRERRVIKEYRAIVFGEMKRREGTIRARIGRKGSRGGQSLWGVFLGDDKSDGMRAETAYEVIETKNGLSSMRLFPKTGRTHQIRVHLNHIGYPILGDKLYGTQICHEGGTDRMLLHALRLELLGISVEAPLPAAFKEWFFE